MNYKGIQGTIGFDPTDSIFFGKILGVDDLIIYEAYSFQELEEKFRSAVERYIFGNYV